MLDPASPTYPLRERLAAGPLSRVGLACQRFERFVSQEPHLHGHDILEMGFVVAGHCEHLIEGRRFAMGPGSLGIVHYGERHGYRTGPEGVDIINLYCDPERHPLPDLPDPLRRLLPEVLPLARGMGHRCNRVVHVQFASPDELLPLLQELLVEQERAERGQLHAIVDLYRLLLIRLLRAVERGAAVHGGHMHPRAIRMESLRRDLDRHFLRAWRLDELAERAACSPTSLCRAFKRHTGFSPQHYLRQRRIQHAMLLLRGQRIGIAEIARQCGFGGPAQFSRAFKALTGQSPRVYRRSVQQDTR